MLTNPIQFFGGSRQNRVRLLCNMSRSFKALAAAGGTDDDMQACIKRIKIAWAPLVRVGSVRKASAKSRGLQDAQRIFHTNGRLTYMLAPTRSTRLPTTGAALTC